MKATFLSVLLISLAPAASVAAGLKVQCWTDEHGHRACGDSVPPQYADKERDVVNQRGVVVDKKERAKTAAEVEAAERAEQQAEEERKRVKQQEAYDRFLMQTYQSVDELETARDARLSALTTRINLADKAAHDSQKTLETLKARAADLQKEGKPADEKLNKHIAAFQRSTEDNTKALEQLKTEHDAVDAEFTRDIARYQELRKALASAPRS